MSLPRPTSVRGTLPGMRSQNLASNVAGALLLLGSVAACSTESPDTSPSGRDAEEPSTSQAHHFDYDAGSAHGPERWGDTPGWERCSTGKLQSPVDVPIAQAAPLAEQVTLSYSAGTLSVLNNAHTVNVRPDGDNTVSYEGRTFGLAQIHLHADSEHDLDGAASPLEAHFVHGLLGADGALATTKDADTGAEILAEYLVLGVMLKEGRTNPAWGRILDRDVLPGEVGDDYTLASDKPFDPTTLLPANRDAYSYSGSLTTPTPTCVEGVNWFVLTTPVEVSAEQIEAFTDLYPHNSRPIQTRP